MTLSFMDAGVLIQVVRGNEAISETTLDVIYAADRKLASSFYLLLEVLPKAQYNQRNKESQFYQFFSELVTVWATDWEVIHKEAERQSRLYGLGAMDALHIAAALSVRADEFVTAERADRSIFRTPDIRVVSSRPKPVPILP